MCDEQVFFASFCFFYWCSFFHSFVFDKNKNKKKGEGKKKRREEKRKNGLCKRMYTLIMGMGMGICIEN